MANYDTDSEHPVVDGVWEPKETRERNVSYTKIRIKSKPVLDAILHLIKESGIDIDHYIKIDVTPYKNKWRIAIFHEDDNPPRLTGNFKPGKFLSGGDDDKYTLMVPDCDTSCAKQDKA